MKIQRRKPLTARVGILGVGHHVYWPQFDGLRDEMLNKMDIFSKKLSANHVEPTELLDTHS